MKELVNLAIYSEFLKEYTDALDLKNFLQQCGCHGVEAIRCDIDERDIVDSETIVGVHLKFYPAWIDFWNGDKAALIKEFGDSSTWENFYGGATKEVLVKQFQEELDYAQSVGASYVVFHVSDVTIEGVFTHHHLHTDEEVIDATVELINSLLDGKDYTFDFLMENLWWPGLTMTNPDMTKRLLEGVNYAHKGIMLDTGHLMCANMELQSSEEAWEYVKKMLRDHGDLCGYIKGIHLHESVTGAYAKAALRNIPPLADSYYKRFSQVYELLGHIDTHQPVTHIGARAVIDQLEPKYLVHELQVSNRKERENKLKQQRCICGL